MTKREQLRNFINESPNFSVCVWNGRKYLGDIPIIGYRCINGTYTWTGVLYNYLTVDLPKDCIESRESDVHLPAYFHLLTVPANMRALVDEAYLQMSDISPFNPFGKCKIVGFRYIRSELYYTILSEYGETYDISTVRNSGLYEEPIFY